MSVRCKFRVNKRVQEVNTHGIEATAVYDGSPENKEFWKWTPSGSFAVQGVRPEQFADFAPGTEFYIDLTICPKPEPVVEHEVLPEGR